MFKYLMRLFMLILMPGMLAGIPGLSTLRATASDSSIGSDQDSIPVYHLGEIVVVGDRRSEPKASVSEINSNIMNATGTNTVKEALNSVPGVVTTNGSKGESRLQIRGFQGRETMILLDGRPISLPYYGDLDLNSIPMSNISKIKVIKGPAGAVYGANTLGGLVNIVSKRINTGATRELKLSFGENETYDAGINLGATYHNLDYWASFGLASSGGYNLSGDFDPVELEDGGLRDNSDYRNFNLDTKLNLNLDDGTVLSMSAGYYNSVRGLPTGTDRGTYQEFPDWRRYYLDLGGDGLINDNIYWKGKLYYDVCKNRLKRYGDDSFSDDNLIFDSFHDSFDVGGRLAFMFAVTDRLENTSGVVFRVDGIDRQEDAGEPWVYNQTASGSLFSQFEYSPTDLLSLEAGAAWNRMEPDAIDASISSLDPYFGLSVVPLDRLNVHLAGSKATRFPTLNHFFSTSSGNPDLRPEKAVKLEAGYKIDLTSALSFKQDYFWNDVDDLIDRRSRNDIYENIDEVILKGVETGIDYARGKQLRLSVSHTYLDAYEWQSGIRRYHSPRNKTDYSISYKPGFGLTLNHTGQYISDRLDPDLVRMPDYYLAHLRISYVVKPYLTLFVNARNLLDKNYEEERYYPMPGRCVMLGFEAGY